MRSSRVTTLLLVFAGCGSAEVVSTEAATERRADAIASLEGDIEAGIDAPWRLEPIPGAFSNVGILGGGGSTFPPIPIVVTIHDASMQTDPDTLQPLGSFCSITVSEAWKTPPPPPYDGRRIVHTTRVAESPPAYEPLQLREIERSDNWPVFADDANNHRVCRRWLGESCRSVLDVGSAAEWHATFTYTPEQYSNWQHSRLRSGDDVNLMVDILVARAGRSCPPALGNVFPNVPIDLPRDRLRRFGPDFFAMQVPLKIHLGDAPLPRFDPNWLYGDLHYHSQGTDNEGESAYAFRPTLQAMRAIGLDFSFATDHASDSTSGQTTDLDEIFVDDIPPFPQWAPSAIEEFVLRLASKFTIGVQTNTNAARDMNPRRFAAMRRHLNLAGTGANAEVLMAAPGRNFAPRLFLGGEVDVVPEMTTAERASGSLLYGNGKRYRWAAACTDIPDQIVSMLEWTNAVTCNNPFQLAEPLSDPDRWAVLDIQGLGERLPARQHLVHLPFDGVRDDAFISSSTGKFGGASRRLKHLLQQEYVNGQKGIAFLAHPVAAASGKSVGRLGPDIVPYSDVQLRTAFENQSVLGLQLWNEDTRAHSVIDGYWEWPKDENGQRVLPAAYDELHHGLFAWDKLLQWGLRPSQTASIGWLPANEPRRVFMAGGSDAHGDWNYRREGAIEGNSGLVDTAIGKPRNLVNAGAARPETVVATNGTVIGVVSQQQVTGALASGEFIVTDGPILRIAIDRNNNGVIDSGDSMMGSVSDALTSLGNIAAAWFPLLVEWKSTPEFGPVSDIDLYVGVTNFATDLTLVYAPVNHGVHGRTSPAGTVDPKPYRDPAQGQHWALLDGYMKDPNGLLHIDVAAADGWQGTRRLLVFPGAFPAGRLRVVEGVPPEPICRLSWQCFKPGFLDQCEEICRQPPTPPDERYFDGPYKADRLYVRGFARTAVNAAACSVQLGYGAANSKCSERLAFTNPLWVRNGTVAPPPPPPPPPPRAQLGEECSASLPCTCEGYCPAAAAPFGRAPVCVRRLVAGSRCTDTRMCDGQNYCTGTVCALRLPVGAVCGGKAPCVEGAVCSTGLCRASNATCEPPR